MCFFSPSGRRHPPGESTRIGLTSCLILDLSPQNRTILSPGTSIDAKPRSPPPFAALPSRPKLHRFTVASSQRGTFFCFLTSVIRSPKCPKETLGPTFSPSPLNATNPHRDRVFRRSFFSPTLSSLLLPSSPDGGLSFFFLSLFSLFAPHTTSVFFSFCRAHRGPAPPPARPPWHRNTRIRMAAC